MPIHHTIQPVNCYDENSFPVPPDPDEEPRKTDIVVCERLRFYYALCTLNQQCESLRREVKIVFDNLSSEAEHLATRTDNCTLRANKLQQRITCVLKEEMEQKRNSKIASEGERQCDKKVKFDHDLFTPISRPQWLVEMCNSTMKVPALSLFDKFRFDGKDLTKTYFHDPSFFYEFWKQQQENELRARIEKKGNRKKTKREKQEKRRNSTSKTKEKGPNRSAPPPPSGEPAKLNNDGKKYSFDIPPPPPPPPRDDNSSSRHSGVPPPPLLITLRRSVNISQDSNINVPSMVAPPPPFASGHSSLPATPPPPPPNRAPPAPPPPSTSNNIPHPPPPPPHLGAVSSAPPPPSPPPQLSMTNTTIVKAISTNKPKPPPVLDFREEILQKFSKHSESSKFLRKVEPPVEKKELEPTGNGVAQILQRRIQLGYNSSTDDDSSDDSEVGWTDED